MDEWAQAGGECRQRQTSNGATMDMVVELILAWLSPKPPEDLSELWAHRRLTPLHPHRYTMV